MRIEYFSILIREHPPTNLSVAHIEVDGTISCLAISLECLINAGFKIVSIPSLSEEVEHLLVSLSPLGVGEFEVYIVSREGYKPLHEDSLLECDGNP